MSDFRKLVDGVLQTSTRVFGEDVKFLPNTGGVFLVRAVFDSEFQVIDPDTRETISANQPGVGVNLNDFEFDPKVGDQFEIREIRYKVTVVKEDGQGGATLLLNKVKASDKPQHPRTR